MADRAAGALSGAQVEVVARVASIGVHATPARLTAWQRQRSERGVRTAFTFAATAIAAPLAFLVPPHLEPAAAVFLLGLYFTRRAWVGEWEAIALEAACPRCDAALKLRRGTILFIPHTLTCGACRGECWLELEAAPHVEEAERREAQERARRVAEPDPAADRRPPTTWSPASSDWRDRPRE